MLLPASLVTPCSGTGGYSLHLQAKGFEKRIIKFDHLRSELGRSMRNHFSEKQDRLHSQDAIPRPMMMDLGEDSVFPASSMIVGNNPVAVGSDLIQAVVWCSVCARSVMKTSCPRELTAHAPSGESIVDFESEAFVEAARDVTHRNYRFAKKYKAKIIQHCKKVQHDMAGMPSILHFRQLNGLKKAVETYNEANPDKGQIGYEAFREWCRFAEVHRAAREKSLKIAWNEDGLALFWKSQIEAYTSGKCASQKKSSSKGKNSSGGTH